MAGDAWQVRLHDWLHGSQAQWGVWIGRLYVVASYDSMIAVFDRSSGAVVWHGGVGERPPLEQVTLESYGETFEFF